MMSAYNICMYEYMLLLGGHMLGGHMHYVVFL